MRKRKGFRRVLSLAAAGIMALSLISVGGAGSISEAAELDSASSVNHNSILGRAVNYGIVADTFELNNHSETNFAVNTFVNVKNDVIEADLAGDEPMYYIMGDVKGGPGTNHDYLRFGNATFQSCKAEFYFDTTSKIADTLSNTEKTTRKIWCDNDGNPAIHAQTHTSAEISSSISTMVKHIQDESKKLEEKPSTIDIKKYEADKNINDNNQYVIDLSDKTGSNYTYKDKVVYITVPEDSVLGSIFKESGKTEALRINKPSSTVVVFNFNGWTKADVKGPLVHVVDKDFTSYESSGFINSKTGNGQWEKNAVVDSEIAQKIVWNLPDATNVEIREAAGLMLIPNDEAKVSVESTSSGWVVTGGTFRNNNSEWHYIYRGRQKELNGELTIAAQKRFTRSYKDYTVDSSTKEKNLKDDTKVSTAAGDFNFKLYKSDANFTVSESNLIETVSTTATNAFEFSKLTFTTSDDGKDFYYVVKEDLSKKKDGITNSDGEIDIKIHVDVVGGLVKLKASSWKYLTAADKAADNRATATSVENSTAYRVNYDLALQGTQFTLGSVYNLVNKGSLSVTKTVTGAPTSTSGKEYSFTIKNSAGKWIKADGSISDSEVKHTIKDGETKTFDGLSFDTYTVTEDKTGAEIAGCTLDSTSVTEGTATIAVAGETKTVALKNIYKQDTGSLSITKKVEKKGDVTKTLPTSFRFAVKNSDGNYITDNNGTVGTSAPYYFSGISANATLKINNLPVGKYTIEEADARVADLTLAVTGLEEVTVTKNATKSVEVTNTYETPKKEVGELHIKKTTTGDTVPAGKTFPVSISFDKAGSYAVNVNGAGVKMVAFEANVAQVFEINNNGSIDITDILLDTTYNVKEVLSEEDKAAGYSMVSISDNSIKKIATADQKETVTISNKYTKNKVGVLELVKTINGELTKEEREGKLKFTVTGPNNYNKTFKISETDEQGLKLQSDGTYKLTLTNMPVGNYSVTETTEKIDGKTVTVKYSIGNGSGLTEGSTASNVLITDGGTTVVNFENTYEEVAAAKGSLNIRKQFSGDEPSKDIKDKIAFTISKDGKVVKTVYYKDADNLGSIVVNDLDPGVYTVTESGYEEDGKTVTIATVVSVPDESAVSDTKDSVTVEVKSGKTSGVGYTNTYKKDDTSEEGSSEEGSSEENSSEGGSSKEGTSQESGGNTTSSEDKNGQNTTSSEVSTQQPTTASEQITTQQSGVSTKKTTESDDDEDDDDEDEGKGNLIITIYDEKTGGTVPGAKISVTNPEGKTKKYTTNNDGQVTIKKTAVGDYTVKVTEVPKGYTVSKNAEVDVEVKKNKTTKAQVRIDKNGEVSVTSKTTNSATKTGDALPIVPVMLAFATSILGLIALAFRKRWGV